MTQPDKKTREDYDSPWKDILTDYFEQFVRLFFPHIWPDIDWKRGYISLDKELNRITRDAEMREGKLADKLFRVWKKNGEEMWVLVHVEVQAQKKETFPLRTFVYNYRIYDLYKRPVASLVILADDYPEWHPTGYSHGLWRCHTEFRFPSVKLTDYRDRVEYLEESDNIFAVAVVVHLPSAWEEKKERRKNVMEDILTVHIPNEIRRTLNRTSEEMGVTYDFIRP